MSGITFILDHNLIAQLLGNKSFYAAAPAYYFMRKMGLETVKKWRDHVSGAITGDLPCDNCNDRVLLKPALAAFMSVTLDLHANDKKLLLPLKAYIAKQLGKKVAKVVVHYKSDAGTTKSIEF